MSGRESADVVVIGGGVMGCAVAWSLARRGVVARALLEGPVGEDRRLEGKARALGADVVAGGADGGGAVRRRGRPERQ